MSSVKDKFLLALAISDEGMQMMLQRIRRNHPGAEEQELCEILRKELINRKSNILPSYLKPTKYV